MSSRAVEALRTRYGTAGNKWGRSDAYVLADCLGTDGHRWPSLQPESPTTVTLRSHERARKDFVETRFTGARMEELETRIGELLDAGPDAPTSRSLPRAGAIRAATLLAEIGDCRARFPDPESLACLAGVAPSTRASGRHHAVTFRWAGDNEPRDALCDCAGDSWRVNTWAKARYPQLRADGKRHPHAERTFARRRAHIIWRRCQDHTPYDPTRHSA